MTCLNFSPLLLCLADNQDPDDWRDEDEKPPGHENMTEKDVELFRHIQQLALQVRTKRTEKELLPAPQHWHTLPLFTLFRIKVHLINGMSRSHAQFLKIY